MQNCRRNRKHIGDRRIVAEPLERNLDIVHKAEPSADQVWYVTGVRDSHTWPVPATGLFRHDALVDELAIVKHMRKLGHPNVFKGIADLSGSGETFARLFDLG